MNKYFKLIIFVVFFLINQIGWLCDLRWLTTLGAILIGGFLAFELK